MLSVTKGHPARSIDANHILVELPYLYYHSGAFPSLRVVTDQVLKVNMIPDLQGLEELGVLSPLLVLTRMTLG